MGLLGADFWRKIWNLWEIRVMVMFTLAVQILLIFFGNRRKSSHNLKLRILVWCAYLSADSVATLALGVLSSKLGDAIKKEGHLDDNSKLLAFWAPLLLFLLGGPDTITSYSLEDNALWLRHFLGLGAQTAATAYIIFMAWTSSYLSFLSLAMTIVGLVKYGERACALWMASNDKFKDSVMAPPDPSPNYPRFMQEYTLKQAEGYLVAVDEVIEVQVPEGIPAESDRTGDATSKDIIMAYGLLQVFKGIFVKLILSNDDRDSSKAIFKSLEFKKAFRIIEIELGFMYDLLHTKATLLYTKWGIQLRTFTFSFAFFVLLIFSMPKKSHFSSVDLSITYILLVVILFIEACSILILISSDWSEVWLSKHSKGPALKGASKFIRLPKQPRWSNSIAQFSLLSFGTAERPLVCSKMFELLKVKEKVEKYHYTLHEKVSEELKEWIFRNVKDELLNVEQHHHPVPMKIKEKLVGLFNDYELKQAIWSAEGEFDQIILTWHIATELSYYSDLGTGLQALPEYNIQHFQLSKLLSRYMFYLLVMYPSTLPSGIGDIRLRDTSAEALKFFKEHKIDKVDTKSNEDPDRLIKNLKSRGQEKEINRHLQKASKMLLEVNTEVPPSKVKGGKSKSVLFDGCRLVADIRGREMGIKWETIAKLWATILMFAASQCKGEDHAGQLRRGGELLTHVWLLMVHHGMTDHFQMTQGQSIARLILK